MLRIVHASGCKCEGEMSSLLDKCLRVMVVQSKKRLLCGVFLTLRPEVSMLELRQILYAHIKFVFKCHDSFLARNFLDHKLALQSHASRTLEVAPSCEGDCESVCSR